MRIQEAQREFRTVFLGAPWASSLRASSGWSPPPSVLGLAGVRASSLYNFYGMNQFGILAGILIAGGIALAMFLPDVFSAGGWLTGIILVGYALVIWRTVVPQMARPAPS